MEIALLFIGVVVSAIVQFIKTRWETKPLVTVFSTIGMAVFAAIGVWFLEYFGWMEAFMQIIMTAGAFYAFIIRNIEKTLGE